ncbi:hypothetical protein GOP47_0031041, partial [Adiantum capillus-veneris]
MQKLCFKASAITILGTPHWPQSFLSLAMHAAQKGRNGGENALQETEGDKAQPTMQDFVPGYATKGGVGWTHVDGLAQEESSKVGDVDYEEWTTLIETSGPSTLVDGRALIMAAFLRLNLGLYPSMGR